MKAKTSTTVVPGLRSVPLTSQQRALIIAHRRAAGLSQKALGKKVGVTMLSIHNIESGNYRPKPKVLAKLCRVLKLRVQVRLQVDLVPDKAVAKRGTRASAKRKRKKA